LKYIIKKVIGIRFQKYWAEYSKPVDNALGDNVRTPITMVTMATGSHTSLSASALNGESRHQSNVRGNCHEMIIILIMLITVMRITSSDAPVDSDTRATIVSMHAHFMMTRR